MNSEKPSFRLSPRRQGYLALLLWGVATLLLVRRDVYGLDEFAARALVLSWSISGDVANAAIISFGMPDLRILAFLPIGFAWPGQVLAAKVVSALVLAIAARLLYMWRSGASGPEGALLGTGLLLVSPLTLAQIDSVSAGGYLLASFAIGAWLDGKYRANPRPFNGWFFALLFTCAFSTSLHPAGLAFPLALLWSWRTLPQSVKYQRIFLAGVVFSASFLLVLREGWGGQLWLQNPVFALSSAFTGPAVDADFSWASRWLPGSVLLALALLVALKSWRRAWPDLAGRSLVIAMVLGAFVGDHAWALVVLAFVLYFGLPFLLSRNQPAGEGEPAWQRTVLLAAVFACTTVFMLADKAYFASAHRQALSAQDELIRTLAVAAEDERKAEEGKDDEGTRAHFWVASEWPGRTMIACKCDTFPLPRVVPNDPKQQLQNLRGIDYVLFDPKQTVNIELARNFSLLVDAAETVALQPGGVIVHIKEGAPPVPEGKKTQ